MGDWSENERAMRPHQGRGPAADPRAAYHKQYTPDPDFVALCNRADERAVQVRLEVSRTLVHAGDEERERRDLTRVNLVAADATIGSGALMYNTSLGVVSRRLLEQLG